MVRILLGVLKGGLVGAGIGYLAGSAGLAGSALAFAIYGIVGALVGVVCGKPIWRQETLFTPLLKAIFGFGLGVGLYFLGRKFLGGVHLPLDAIPGAAGQSLTSVPLVFAPVVGILYGVLIELDDASGSKKEEPKSDGGSGGAPPRR